MFTPVTRRRCNRFTEAPGPISEPIFRSDRRKTGRAGRVFRKYYRK